jgi:hypothetical protein
MATIKPKIIAINVVATNKVRMENRQRIQGTEVDPKNWTA